MPNIWFISDTHFSHANILKFKDADGSYFRGDRFTSVDHMNDVMNVHGHIHQNNSPSHRHINISVEKTDYKPVNIDELRSRGS